MKGIHLHYLAFTGPEIGPAELKFESGLNIIYGASNTGKSFAAKVILFMLGANTSLPETDEIAQYDGVWLGISLRELGEFTLYRAARGGDFTLYPGLIKGQPDTSGKVLRGKHDTKRTDNISHWLLDAIGLSDKRITRDGNGTKDSLSIRLLSKYAVVTEEDILSENSPVYLSRQQSERTLESNLFKLMLTGNDDAAAVTVPKESERKVAKAAKLELVDELLAQLNAELGEDAPTEIEARDQLARLDKSIASLQSQLELQQNDLDSNVAKRRDTLDLIGTLTDQGNELELTLQRFAKLQAVYSSDLERLQSIEEGGYVLAAMARRNCPVCGAPPQAQTHSHAKQEIALAQTAAAAEATKIEREMRELESVVSSLEIDRSSLRGRLAQLDDESKALNKAIHALRPQEASFRASYEEFIARRVQARATVDLHERSANLTARREAIGAEPVRRRKGEAAPVGPASTTLHDFGETVKAVLTAWHFPDADKAQFDGGSNDIIIRGKRRSANGKGVRAVLHAAFKVAVIVHCIENEKPHPGFLVLDTPLLTYREPLTSKYGDLTEDEVEIKATSLAEHFYAHLASLSNHVQVLVLENSDPPAVVNDIAHIEVFTKLPGNGRFGLLAPMPPKF